MMETLITLFQRQLIIFDKKIFFKSIIFIFMMIQTNNAFALSEKDTEMLRGNKIGHILSGNKKIDDLSANGLNVISSFVSSKTASIFDKPKSINLDKDDLYFYPLSC